MIMHITDSHPDIEPFSLRDAPALIERLLSVQKLSAESYKEQMAVHGKTLTALGSYWKGRKPLILSKACVLGCLLPATDNPKLDLEIFDMLMGMDDISLAKRWKKQINPSDIVEKLSIDSIADYFHIFPSDLLPQSAPIDLSNPAYENVKIKWRNDIGEDERYRLKANMLLDIPYRDCVKESRRPEEILEGIHNHIWDSVNSHLHTNAKSIPELIEQLGIMRFGQRPKIGDPFCGSGQIPFEAARLGCNVFASDLNPIACMLTWGAFNIVGASTESRKNQIREQEILFEQITKDIERLGIESDGNGWKAKVFLYCLEVRCPQSNWIVPVLPSLLVSKGYRVIAELIPIPAEKRYEINLRTIVNDNELEVAKIGTLRSDGRGQEPYLLHTVDGHEYRTKISTIRGDSREKDGSTGNKLRLWGKTDVTPKKQDIFQERLYAIQWSRKKASGKSEQYEFRAVTQEDIRRENLTLNYVAEHFSKWQNKGWIPDMRIEPGDKTTEPIRTRGWTYWHHLFNPRQLLLGALLNKYGNANLKPALCQVLNSNSRLSRWSASDGGGGAVKQTFYNQALNTLYNYGCRGSTYSSSQILQKYSHFPLKYSQCIVRSDPADKWEQNVDIFISDPPYGDAVKYEEILEFFIAWMRKNPPSQFSDWIWDSRRALAIKGEDDDFRRRMVTAYKRMTNCMPENGIQVIMFTHQSASIWADMANIVWASGLQVTAAWYVVTETDSALREGSFVKGTVLLVCRKRAGSHEITRDDLAWEIQEGVEDQIDHLTGLNQEASGFNRDENVFNDADLQMAGYAAALRSLTRYSIIDGRDMTLEVIRPRLKGETTFVDELIDFAVNTANQCLVPKGIKKSVWMKLTGVERFYIKMIDMEARGLIALDNYQNFAKAFKVGNMQALMGDQRANHARLKNAVEFGDTEMSRASELHDSILRAVLYSLMELQKDMESNEVLTHLMLNVPDYYGDSTQRERICELARYLSDRLEYIRPEEASAARVLRELVLNQRVG